MKIGEDGQWVEVDPSPSEEIKVADGTWQEVQQASHDQTFRNVLDYNPDQTAEVIDLSKKLKAPIQFVRDNLDRAKQIANRPDFEKLSNLAPTLSDMARQEYFLALAKDDLDPLAEIEAKFDHKNEPSWYDVLVKDTIAGAANLVAGTQTFLRGSRAAYQQGIDEVQQRIADEEKEYYQKQVDSGAITQEQMDEALAIRKTKSVDPIYNALDENLFQPANDLVANFSANIEDYYKTIAYKYATKYEGTFMENPSFKRGVSAFMNGGVSMAIAVPLSIVLGPEAGAAVLSMSEAGGMYDEAIAAGKTPKEALRYAMIAGSATFMLEKFGLDFVLGKVGKEAEKGILRRVAEGAVGEAGTEDAQQIVQNLVAQIGYDQSRDLFDGIIESTIGGLAGGPAAGIHAYIGQRQREANTETASKLLQELSSSVEASRLKQRSPETFAEYINRVATDRGRDAKVYLDAQTAVEKLNQAGVDVRAWASQYGVNENDLATALSTGGSLALDMGKAAANIGTDENLALFQKDLTLRPHDATTDQLAGEAAVDQAVATGLQEEYQKEQKRLVTPDDVDQLRQAMIDAKIPKRAAEQYSLLLGARANAWAKATGRTAKEWFSRHGITVQREAYADFEARQTGQQIYGQDGKIDFNSEAFKKWFGDSKVVDDNGGPLVVYHGTGATDITQFLPEGGGPESERVLSFYRDKVKNNKPMGYMNFRSGSFFSPKPEYAGNYVGENPETGDKTGVMYPVYIKAENPVYLDMATKKAWGSDPKKTPDALILMEGDSINEVAVIDPTQVKSVFNRGTFDPADPNILNQSAQRSFPAFKQWSDNAPYIPGDAALDHEFKTGEKVVVEGYHGTARPDRVGTKFLKKRATSGPMAFFTSDPVLASSYAEGKQDTSLAYEDQNYESWFKYKPKGSRSFVSIDRAWYFLDQETKQKIYSRMGDIRLDDEGNVVYEEGGGDLGNYQWELQQTKRGYDRAGNPLKAAVESWLMSGAIFGEEQRFNDVLELAGFPMADLKYDNPGDTFPAVYKVYVAMKNPLVTDNIPQEVIDALHNAAKKDRSRAKLGGADMWDKNTRTLKEWVENFDKEDNSYVWSSIPDKVTAVFESFGYDGIIDIGGKSGGKKHKVYIPFNETQVKSALGNKGTFRTDKNDILFQSFRPTLTEQDIKDMNVLRVAIKTGDTVNIGTVEEMHSELFGRKNLFGEDVTLGWATPDGEFLTREEAAGWIKEKAPAVYKELSDKAALESADYGQAVGIPRRGYDSPRMNRGDIQLFQSQQSNGKTPVAMEAGYDPKNLYVAHNLTASKLLHADGLGGLAVPSLAVVNIDHGAFDSFGDITLIADPAILESRKARTFNADVYSPRHPSAVYEIERKGFNAFIDSLSTAKKIAGDLRLPDASEIESRGPEELLHNDLLKVAFLLDRGVKFSPKKIKAEPWMKKALALGNLGPYQLQDSLEFKAIVKKDLEANLKKMDGVEGLDAEDISDFRKRWFDETGDPASYQIRDYAAKIGYYRRSGGIDSASVRAKIAKEMRNKETAAAFENFAAEKFNTIVSRKKIFKGFTPSGNRKYAEYNLENIVAEMTKELQGGEGFNYGAGSVRAAYAKELKTVAAVKAARGTLVTAEEMKAIKDESQEKLSDALEALRPFYKFSADSFGYYDDASSAIAEGPKGWREAFDLTDESRKIITDLVEYLKGLPSEYFEAKIQRPVRLGEFQYAVVPKGTNQKAIDALENNLIKVEFYDPKKDGSREKAIRNLAKGFDNVLFQPNAVPAAAIVPNPGDMQIFVFEKANLSSILHEVGHLFLFDMKMTAEQDGVMVEEWQAVQDWLGVKDGKITTAQHEKFAKGFEMYLREGSAPSLGLRKAFRSFRKWLTSIYRAAKQLDVELTDEVRQVFDKLLATEDEIAEARATAAMQKLFDDAFISEQGLSDDFIRQYNEITGRTMDEAMDKMDRHRLSGREERVRMWNAQAEEESWQQKVYRAAYLLARGTEPGQGGRVGQGAGISISDVISSFGQEVYDSLPKIPGLFRTEGASIGQAAAEAGYGSAQELIESLKGMEKRTDWVENRVRQLEGEYDKSLPAEEAIRNNAAAKQLEAESKVLAPFAKKVAATRKAMRIWAEKVTAGQTLGKATEIYQLIQVSRKLRRQAIAAQRSGDYATAFLKNEQVRLNEELISVHIKVRDQLKKIEKRMNGRANANIALDYRNQLNVLLKRFGLTKKNVQIDRDTLPLPQFMNGIMGDDEVAIMSVPAIAEWLGGDKMVPYKQLTWQEMQDVSDLADFLYGRGKEILNDHLSDQKTAAADLAEETAAPARTTKGKRIFKEGSVLRRITDASRQFFAGTDQLLWIFRAMDGYVNTGGGKTRVGANESKLWYRISEASKQKALMMQEMTKKLKPHLDVLVAGAQGKPALFTHVAVPKVMADDGRGWTWERIVMVALNMGNEGNIERLMKGYALSYNDLQTLISVMNEEEINAVQGIIDAIDSMFHDIDAVHRRINHFGMRKVESSPMALPAQMPSVINGVKIPGRPAIALRGGYFPLKYDRGLSLKIMKWTEKDDILNSTEAILQTPAAKSGFTKARTRSSLPVDLSFGVIAQHVHDTVQYITHAEAIKDVDRVTQHSTYREAAIHALGKDGYLMIRPALKYALRPEKEFGGTLDKWVDKERVRAATFVLAWNFRTALLQPTAASLAVRRIGPAAFGRGLLAMAANPIQSIRFMQEVSPFMLERAKNIDRDLIDARKAMKSNGRFSESAWDRVVEAGFIPIQFMDALISYPTWQGAYRTGLEKFGGDMDKAVLYADDAVRTTSGSGTALDLSAMQRDSRGWMKLFTMFSSFTMGYGNMQRNSYNAWRNGTISTTEYAWDTFMTAIFPSVAATFAFAVLTTGEPPEPEDMAKDLVSWQFMGLPIVRDLIGYAIKVFPGQSAVVRSPALLGTELLGAVLKDTYELGADFIEDGDISRKNQKKIAWDIANLASYVMKVPASKIYERIMKGIDQMEDGDGGPWNLLLPDPSRK